MLNLYHWFSTGRKYPASTKINHKDKSISAIDDFTMIPKEERVTNLAISLSDDRKKRMTNSKHEKSIRTVCAELDISFSKHTMTPYPFSQKYSFLRAQKSENIWSYHWTEPFKIEKASPQLNFVECHIKFNGRLSSYNSMAGYDEVTKSYDSYHRYKFDSPLIKDYRLSDENAESFYSLSGKNLQLYAEPTYNIRQLQEIHVEQFTTAHLFGKLDFVIPPEQNGRKMVKVKLGQLFISFEPGGKDSFFLKIQYIDPTDHRLLNFLTFDGNRSPLLSFEHFIPISLDSFNFDRTLTRGAEPHDYYINSVQFFHASRIKQALTKLMLAQPLVQKEFCELQESCLALFDKFPDFIVNLEWYPSTTKQDLAINPELLSKNYDPNLLPSPCLNLGLFGKQNLSVESAEKVEKLALLF